MGRYIVFSHGKANNFLDGVAKKRFWFGKFLKFCDLFVSQVSSKSALPAARSSSPKKEAVQTCPHLRIAARVASAAPPWLRTRGEMSHTEALAAPPRDGSAPSPPRHSKEVTQHLRGKAASLAEKMVSSDPTLCHTTNPRHPHHSTMRPLPVALLLLLWKVRRQQRYERYAQGKISTGISSNKAMARCPRRPAFGSDEIHILFKVDVFLVLVPLLRVCIPYSVHSME